MRHLVKWSIGWAGLMITMIGLSSSAQAGQWNFHQSCSDEIGHEVQTIPPPNLMLMLDRSGSMDWNTQVPIDCHMCEWSARSYDPECEYSGEVCAADWRVCVFGHCWEDELWIDFDNRDINCTDCYSTSQCISKQSSLLPDYLRSRWWVPDYCGYRDVHDVSYEPNARWRSGKRECSWCRNNSHCQSYMNNRLSSWYPRHTNLSAKYKHETCRTQTRRRWDVAVEAIDAVVGSLTSTNPDQVHFGIGFFPYTRIAVESKANAHSDIMTAIANTGPGGGTPMDDGIRVMKNSTSVSNPPPNSSSAGVLLTDGVPNDRTAAVREACNHANTAPMYVVGFGSGTDERFNDILAVAGGTGSGCSRADICANPGQYNYSRFDSCDGSYPAYNSAQLQVAFTSIANEVSCTFDVDALGDAWKNPAQGCTGDNYDCLKIRLNGSVNQTIYHVGSSQGPNGWKFVSSDLKTVRVLDINDGNPATNYCSKIQNGHISDSGGPDLSIQRACICERAFTSDPSCGQSDLEYKLGRNLNSCECPVGNWMCQGRGQETCEPEAPCGAQLVNDGVFTCSPGEGVCERTGPRTCTGGPNGDGQDGSLTCSVSADWSQSGPEDCDGLDNDCDGQIDEGLNTGAYCHVDYVDNPGPAEQDAIDDETIRCNVGLRSCTGGAWACEPLDPMPEVCNGIDDDCDPAGNIDNLTNSWKKQEFANYSLTGEYKPAACYEKNTCACANGHDKIEGTNFSEYLDSWSNGASPPSPSCLCGEGLTP